MGRRTDGQRSQTQTQTQTQTQQQQTKLKLNQDLAKCYYRRALSLSIQNDLDGATQDLQRALEYAPDDAGIKREMKNLVDRRKARLEKQRQQFSKMFGGADWQNA